MTQGHSETLTPGPRPSSYNHPAGSLMGTKASEKEEKSVSLLHRNTFPLWPTQVATSPGKWQLPACLGKAIGGKERVEGPRHSPPLPSNATKHSKPSPVATSLPHDQPSSREKLGGGWEWGASSCQESD